MEYDWELMKKDWSKQLTLKEVEIWNEMMICYGILQCQKKEFLNK